MTTDVSVRGAFVTTKSKVQLPVGMELTVEYIPQNTADSPIYIEGIVSRSVKRPSRVSRMPGMAIEFLRYVSPGGAAPLALFLQDLLGCTLDDAESGTFGTDDTGATIFDVEPVEGPTPRSHARHVHTERLSPERTLPDDARSAEELLRKIVTDIERRRVRRFAVHVDVTYYLDEREVPHRGVVLNVSQRGLFIQTDHAVPKLGVRVKLQLPVDEDGSDVYVRIEGTVRRRWDPSTEGLPGFGIRLDRIDEMGHTGVFRMYLRRLERRGRRRHLRGYHYAMRRRQP